jgi:hypothetical protein
MIVALVKQNILPFIDITENMVSHAQHNMHTVTHKIVSYFIYRTSRSYRYSNPLFIPDAMELITLLLGVALFVVCFLFLYRQGAKRARFVGLVNKLPGPPAYPIVGNALEMAVPRNRKYENKAGRLRDRDVPGSNRDPVIGYNDRFSVVFLTPSRQLPGQYDNNERLHSGPSVCDISINDLPPIVSISDKFSINDMFMMSHGTQFRSIRALLRGLGRPQPISDPFYERLELSWLAYQCLMCDACGNRSLEYLVYSINDNFN